MKKSIMAVVLGLGMYAGAAMAWTVCDTEWKCENGECVLVSITLCR